MHIEKNVFDNLFFTMIGSRDKRNKDDLKSRRDLPLYCRRKELELKFDGRKYYKPKATFSLGRDDVEILCEWLKELKFPDGYVSNIGNCVNTSD